MSGYMKVVEQLVIDRILSNSFPLTGKSKVGLGLMTLSVLFLILGMGFLIFGAHIWFTIEYPPHIAFVLTGCLLASIGLLACLISIVILQYQRTKARYAQAEIQNQIKDILLIANDEMGDVVRDNPKLAMVGALFAGYIASEKLMK